MSSATLPVSASPSVSADEAEILALGAALHKAHLEKSPEGIAAPFAPHAVIFDLEPPLSHDGISVERKRKWLEGWDTPLELIAQDFKVTVSCESKDLRLLFVDSILLENGRPPSPIRVFANRFSLG
jgi:hypothetical protein